MPTSMTTITIEKVCDDPHLNRQIPTCDCFEQINIHNKKISLKQCKYLDYSSTYPICEYERKIKDE